MDARRQDRFWNQLLKIINKGHVIPVVGEDMLYLSEQVDENLYKQLARRYAEYSGIELSNHQSFDLSSTVRSHPEFRNNPYDVYQEIGEEYELWDPEIPKELLQLAKISHFNLFVSTTFDNLLERAINQERFEGQKLTRVLSYSPKDIPSDYQVSEALSSGKPVIFQLFGNYKNPLQFALTEGDKVEYMHALQSTEYCPKRMLAELQDRPLLLLGNNFPDWMTRSFLRMARKTPLDHRDVPKQYFADAITAKSSNLKSYLSSFTTNTEVIEDQTPAKFTEELVKRWDEQLTEGSEQSDIKIEASISVKPMQPNAVFISYCSQDRYQASALKNALEEAGVVVWMDYDQLKGGDKYETKIRRYINTCSLFIPLISPTCNSRSEGFFRREWDWALRRLPTFTGASRQFILPTAIGDVDPYNSKIPDDFKHFHFFQLPDTGPDRQLVETIKSIYNTTLEKETLQGIA